MKPLRAFQSFQTFKQFNAFKNNLEKNNIEREAKILIPQKLISNRSNPDA